MLPAGWCRRGLERMNFEKVIRRLVDEFEKGSVSYALIGGFAMALRGVQRGTVDLDFILMLDNLGTADGILTGCGYVRVFRSENVSHYESADGDWVESTSGMHFAVPTSECSSGLSLSRFSTVSG